MKIGPLTPCTSDELKFKIVSEINPSFIIILIPRAKPMISDTPTKLDAPSTNASTTTFSPSPSLPNATINIITIVNARNIEAMIGNHQPCVITPHTMIGNGKMNKIKMIFA